MYCESCGSFIPDGQAFCSNCGAPVSQPVPQQAPQPAAEPVSAPAPAPAPQAIPVQPAYQQPAYQQPTYQQPTYQQPAYQQPAYQQPVYTAQPVVVSTVSQAPVKSSNGSAVAGMIFGILAIILAWIPLFNIFTTILFGLLGLIFSIIGIAKKNAKGKAMAITGLVLTILATIFTILYYVFIGGVIASDPELSREFEEIFEFEDVAYTYDSSEDFFIDGDFVNSDNGYVSGVLHIDGYNVQF